MDRRATARASLAEMVCVPAMNRADGPMLTAVGAPAKYRPGTEDSPSGSPRGSR